MAVKKTVKRKVKKAPARRAAAKNDRSQVGRPQDRP